MTEQFKFSIDYATSLLNQAKYKKLIEFSKKVLETNPEQKVFLKFLIIGYFKLNLLSKAYELCVLHDDCPNDIKNMIFDVMSHS